MRPTASTARALVLAAAGGSRQQLISSRRPSPGADSSRRSLVSFPAAARSCETTGDDGGVHLCGAGGKLLVLKAQAMERTKIEIRQRVIVLLLKSQMLTVLETAFAGGGHLNASGQASRIAAFEGGGFEEVSGIAFVSDRDAVIGESGQWSIKPAD